MRLIPGLSRDALSSGLSWPVIGALESHKDLKGNARYTDLYETTLREDTNTIGDSIADGNHKNV